MRQPSSPSPFLIGDWAVRPSLCEIERRGTVRRIEPRLMDVLVCLAAHGRDLVSVETLLDTCWAGFHGDNPVHKAVALLRRALGDSVKAPAYIATVRKRGYRLIAPVRKTGDVDDPAVTRLERAVRRWGRHPSFRRHARRLGPFDERGWQVLASTLLRIAASRVDDGDRVGALQAIDCARDIVDGRLAASDRASRGHASLDV